MKRNKHLLGKKDDSHLGVGNRIEVVESRLGLAMSDERPKRVRRRCCQVGVCSIVGEVFTIGGILDERERRELEKVAQNSDVGGLRR